MKIALVMVKADGTSREFAFDKTPIVIGRDEGAKLRIPLPAVSRKHCEITVDDEELIVADAGSANGTYVNGTKVKEREISPGDLITVGGVVFVVRIDGYPAQIDAKDCYAAGMVSMDDPEDADYPGFPTAPPKPSASSPGKPLNPLTGGGKKDSGLEDLLKDLELGDDDEPGPKKK